MKFRRRFFRWKRRLHISIGLIFAFYFLLLAVTGVMINHGNDWGFDGRFLSRRYLPSAYRPQDGDVTRLDIVITDLHSGRLFGPWGHWLPDVVTLFWVVAVLSGVGMLVYRRLLLAPRALPQPPAREAEGLPSTPSTLAPEEPSQPVAVKFDER